MSMRVGNNIQNTAATFMMKREPPGPPAGLTLDTPLENFLWKAIIVCRPMASWNDLDLILVHRVVKLNSELDMHLREIASEGAIYTVGDKYLLNPRRTLIANIERMLFSYYSRLQVAVPTMTGMQFRTSAMRSDQAAEVINRAKESGLLALPGNA